MACIGGYTIKTELKVYTVNDVVQSLGLHITTVREYIKRGELKVSKVGRKYIITLDYNKTTHLCRETLLMLRRTLN